MRQKGYLILFAIALISLQGCTAPIPPRINPIELPQYGLDFQVILDKKIYQIGEPIIIKMKVKNMLNKTRILRLLPDDKHQLSFEYKLFGASSIHYSSKNTITLNIPPMKEVQIKEMAWIWDQTDDWLKEYAPIGYYFFWAPRLFNVEIDDQSVGMIEVVVEEMVSKWSVKRLGFKIVHPTIEKLESMGIEFYLWKKILKDSISIEIVLINRSNQQRTVSVKPVGTNPIIRVRIFGPAFGGSPILRAMYEFRETLSATIPHSESILATEVIWDFRDQTTGMLVPGGFYFAVIELCGLVEVNGEIVGAIENPVKIKSLWFRKEE